MTLSKALDLTIEHSLKPRFFGATMKKSIQVRVSEEDHRRLKVVCANFSLTFEQVLNKGIEFYEQDLDASDLAGEPWKFKYSICPDTGLRVCEYLRELFVREDGMCMCTNDRVPKEKRVWHGGRIVTCGYMHFSAKGISVIVHRLVAEAFLEDYNHELQVDHINGIKQDNRVQNLRMATHQENQLNSKKYRDSVPLGASVCSISNKWHAKALVNGEKKYLGLFETEKDALEACLKEAEADQ